MLDLKPNVIIFLVVVIIGIVVFGFMIVDSASRTHQIEATTPAAETPLTFEISNIGWPPMGDSLVVSASVDWVVANGTQIITITGPITLTRIK